MAVGLGLEGGGEVDCVPGLKSCGFFPVGPLCVGRQTRCQVGILLWKHFSIRSHISRCRAASGMKDLKSYFFDRGQDPKYGTSDAECDIMVISISDDTDTDDNGVEYASHECAADTAELEAKVMCNTTIFFLQLQI